MGLPPFADTDNFRARHKGFSGTANANQTTTIQFKVHATEDRFMQGGKLLLKNHAAGDKVDFSVVDVEYLYAGILYPPTYGGTAWSVAQPNGVVLDKFVENWYVNSDEQAQEGIVSAYAARIYAGLYMRLDYTSTSILSNVSVKLNMYMHYRAIL